MPSASSSARFCCSRFNLSRRRKSYRGSGVRRAFGRPASARLLSRNFYGALRVADDAQFGVRELAHGTISHGEQYLDPAKRRRPLTYYAVDTGIGMLMTDVAKKGPIRLGVIGLGTGSMAAWGRIGDTVRFYEINERVLDIARTQFTFLADCGSRVDVVLGDARLSLEREPS
jgi:hypothetical protein